MPRLQNTIAIYAILDKKNSRESFLSINLCASIVNEARSHDALHLQPIWFHASVTNNSVSECAQHHVQNVCIVLIGCMDILSVRVNALCVRS